MGPHRELGDIRIRCYVARVLHGVRGSAVQVLGSRRGGLLTLILVAVALVAAGTFLVFQFVERPRLEALTPAPDAAVASARPVIGFGVDGSDRMSDLRITVDGEDVTGAARAVDGRVEIVPGRLPDGPHTVAVSFGSANVFARDVDRSWAFTVDTKAPPLAVTAPKAAATSAKRKVRFTGTSEPGATVTIATGERTKTVTAGPKGGWTTVVRLPEGTTNATITAADAAGNRTVRRRVHQVDTTAPTLNVSAPARGEQLTATDEPLIYGSVPSDDPRALTFSVAVNGKVAVTAKGAEAPSAATAETGYTEVAATDGGPLQLDGKKFALAPGTLPQGRNRITVVVADAAGNTAKVTRVVNVDTTEDFGAHAMTKGAKGADVTALQERLKTAGYYPKAKKTTGVYDARTVAAVRRYQRERKLPVSGSVDQRMLDAMVGRIVVNIGQRKLRLIQDGTVVKEYRIAVGMPGHDTPTGEYEIIEKQVDPTWFPPDSPWAAGLGPIPPGPGNPLGTRWIGTSAPAIGIHGTYADSSIGTAASHGCMRMHIPDVEELYELVTIGMKISIRP